MVTLFGRTYWFIEKQWKNIRIFAFNNRTIFELFLITVYAIEQIVLITLAYLYPKHIFLFVSVFAVIVLSTFAFHKLLMESRIKILEERTMDLNFEKQNIELESQELYSRYNEVIDSYNKLKTQDLNNLILPIKKK